jgi:hypothetical protein
MCLLKVKRMKSIEIFLFSTPSLLLSRSYINSNSRRRAERGDMGGEGCGERVKEGEYGANTMYTCI